jgi:AraC family transcriptional regulator
MPVPVSVVLPLLGQAARHPDGDVSLAALARAVRRSPFEVHRAVRRLTGETTKRYTSRLRLDVAAVALVTTKRAILDVALDCGFASHEVFTRAFLRRFGMSPRAYRARGLVGGSARLAREHAAIVRSAGPCIGLYHLRTLERRPAMSITITEKQLEPRPTLVMRRKTSEADIAKTLGEILPTVWAFAQQRGIALAGPPFTRYVEMGRGLMTVEAGLPIATPARGEGDIVTGELPGGTAAVAMHVGPYDTLATTHAAIERWLDDNKQSAGAPWEVYITDPATTPNPAEWQTEVIYPLGRR